MRNMIIAAALFVLSAPAWAGGSHHGSSGFGGTSATSFSGFEAGGVGRSSASGVFSNRSQGSNKDGVSVTSSKSKGEGESTKRGSWSGYSEGTAGANTFGHFGRH